MLAGWSKEMFQMKFQIPQLEINQKKFCYSVIEFAEHEARGTMAVW